MNKLKIILIDATVLFAISTIFVIAVERAFSLLDNHSVKTDPIVTAILQDDTEEVQKLVEKTAKEDPENASEQSTRLNPSDLVDEHARTALMRAAFVNYSSAEKTAKSDEKRAAMIPLLLDHGAPLDALDKDGWTALMWASWSGLPETVKQLLDRKASVLPADKQGNTALTLAAGRGNAGIVEQLLAANADASLTTRDGKSALDQAKSGMSAYPKKKQGYQKIIALLKGE